MFFLLQSYSPLILQRDETTTLFYESVETILVHKRCSSSHHEMIFKEESNSLKS